MENQNQDRIILSVKLS